MMWNNSVELDDVRALIDCKTSNVQVTLNERTFTYKPSLRMFGNIIDRARSFSVAIWTFTTRSCSDHWPIVVVLTRSIANRSTTVHVLYGAARA